MNGSRPTVLLFLAATNVLLCAPLAVGRADALACSRPSHRYWFDASIHAESRELLDAKRVEVEHGSNGDASPRVIETDLVVARSEWPRHRSIAGLERSDVGRIREAKTHFWFQRVLDSGDESIRVRTYAVRKAAPNHEESVANPRRSPTAEAVTCVPPDQDSWRETSLGSFTARTKTASVWTGSELIIWGGEGRDIDTPLGDGFAYDPSSDTWRKLSVVGAPHPRFGHTLVWTGTEMVVWGGFLDPVAGGTYAGAYDPATDSWRELPSTGAPVPRMNHAAVWTGTEMIVWGGRGLGGTLASGGRYDPVTDTWASLSEVSSPAPREFHTLVWTGNEAIVWGGVDNADQVLGDGAYFDPVTNSWQPTPLTFAPEARVGHSATWTGVEMVVWGGQREDPSQTLASGARLRPGDPAWRALPQGGPSARAMHGAVWTGDSLVVWGGTGDDSQIGGRYVPATNGWVPLVETADPVETHAPAIAWTGSEVLVWSERTGRRIANDFVAWELMNPVSGFLEGRSDHSAVWTGNGMIVWGGVDEDSGIALGDGAIYDPQTDTWVLVDPGFAPAARSEHIAVWDGSTMIVWGGVDESGVRGDGARYHVGSDTWIPLPLVGAPSARTEHAAVWTGGTLLIWGGQGTSGAVNDGASFDPGTDAWSALPVSGLEPRWGHTMVWSGDEAIVWGGETTGGVAANGARFDPSTLDWGSVSGVGAPSARTLHSAVWDGSLMLVWGGAGGGSLSTGASYDPDADTWVPISTTDAPSPRRRHTALWTGSEMLVWGGQTASSYFSDGARYEPGADVWTGLSEVGTPLPRTRHTAVWTGTEMLVWGGASRFGAIYGGGTYYADSDSDGDDIVNFCDCAPEDSSAFSVPTQVTDVVWPGPFELSWSPVETGTGTTYALARGGLTELPDFPSFTCLESGLIGGGATVVGTPLPGMGWAYLVSSSNACGVSGFGSGSEGTERDLVACP